MPEGALVIQMGDRPLERPRGVSHTYRNSRPERVRYLLAMTPRIKGLIATIHATAKRTPDQMREIFRSHDSELPV